MLENHPDKYMQKLVETIRSNCLKTANRLAAAREKTDVKTFDDLLESLPAYHQVLLVGNPRSRVEDLVREGVISVAERQIPTMYYCARHPKEDFIPHYCVRSGVVDFEDLIIGRVSLQTMEALDPVFKQAGKLPVMLLNPSPTKKQHVVGFFYTLKDFKVIAIDDLDTFLSDSQAEDPQTQRLTLLQTLKQFSEELDQTYLIGLDTPSNTLDGILRTEASEIPDLILRTQVILWKEHIVYQLEALKNTRGELFRLDLLYDKDRHLFVEL